MRESPQRFAELLSEGIRRVRIVEDKRIRVIQDELGYLVGREGGAIVEYWRKGNLPPRLADVEAMARELVRRGRLERTWLLDFLGSAGHPAPSLLEAELFPVESATAAVTGPSVAPVAVAREVEAVGDGAALGSEATGPHAATLGLPTDRLPDPAPLPPGSKMPLSRNPHFVGRAGDLLALAAAFNAGQSTVVSPVQTAATTGLGGIGKTQLTSEFVHRYGRYFHGGVFWLSFEDPNAIAAEVAACGGPGALDLRPGFSSLSLEDQVRLVQAAWQEPTPRLLIFDNCENPELVAQWRPASGGCRVLITSRQGEWDPSLDVRVVALDVMTRTESIELLRRYRPDVEDEVLGEIARELGDLPLALHLAGSYLYRYRRAILPTEYLEQLRDPNLLHHPSLQGYPAQQGAGISPTGHIQHVWRTFALSYERLDAENERDALARRLAIHMAHFAPGEPIWEVMLLQTLDLDPNETADRIRAEDAFARLTELGLIQVEGAEGRRIHRLVAAFIRDVAGDEGEEGRRRIKEAVYEELTRTNFEGTPLSLLPYQTHLRSILDRAVAVDEVWGATLFTAMGRHLWLNGDFHGAHSFYQGALEIRRRRLGEENEQTADSYNNMGFLLRDLGDLAGSHQHLEQALAIRLRLLGEDHEDTADTLSELGVLYWTERKIDDAVRHLERALSICERVLEPDHLMTAEVANNLAICLKDGLDDPQRARPYLEQALRIRLAVLGESHPYTALIYHNLGYIQESLEEFEEAYASNLKALEIRKRVHGLNHPDTAHSIRLLGTLLARSGRVAEGKAYLEEALSIFLRTVGENHLLTASAHMQLGLVLREERDWSRARFHLEQSLSIRGAIYRGDHPNIATTLDHLAMLLYNEGELQEAQAYVERGLAMRQALLGMNHLHTALSFYHAGLIAKAHSDLVAARAYYAQALTIYAARLGDEHEQTLVIREELDSF